MNRNRFLKLAPFFAVMFVVLAFGQAEAQTSSTPFTFRAGQSMYIVAYRHIQLPLIVESSDTNQTGKDYYDNALDVEKKVREDIEKWRFFRVADKPSEADFIFLVNLDGSAIEGLAVPFDAYRQHYKEKFDLDALRDAAYGRYLAGPLKLPTIGRLSDRLVKQFREKVGPGNMKSK